MVRFALGTILREIASNSGSRGRPEVGRELVARARLVLERHSSRLWLEEEVERIDHRHVGDEVDRRP